MIKIGDIIDVKIEKLSHDFEGIAKVGEEKFVVFIPQGLVDDELKIEIISKNKHYAKAKIIEIISSKNRIKPFCALYNACGSCNVQNCSYDYSIEQKSIILKDIFKNIIDENKIFPLIKSPDLMGYRRKIQYPARQTKNSKRILMGYFKNNSHELINIKFCPVAPSVMNEIAAFIRENFPFDCYCEKNKKGFLKNVLARFNLKNEFLLVFVINQDNLACKKEFLKFVEKLSFAFKNIKGIFVNLNTNNTNKILSDKTIKISGDDYLIETLKDKKYKIGPVSFFQINPNAASIIFDIIKENIKENSTILDAFGGVGAIGIWISDKASKITLVEENENAIEMAKENFKLNNIQNYEILKGDAHIHFKNFHKNNRIFDYVILDPPRNGCQKEGLKEISEITKNIIYVSCNPQTLKRDIIYLKECGFEPQFIKGVDLFPFTHHIEAICLLHKT